MEEALSKIRPHVTSSLAHQKTPATLLAALESTFTEQKTERTPTAYFAALLTTLDGTIQRKDLSLNDGDMLPAELYLLAFIVPFVSSPIIRANLNTILSLTAPLFPALNPHAPALRSQLSLYQGVLMAMDRAQIEAQGIRQAFASILQLCTDPRPKVRKKAVEVVHDVIAHPPAPLSVHPYSQRVADWTTTNLLEANANPIAKTKGSKQQVSSGADTAIHLLALLRQVLPYLPPTSLPSLTKQLIDLPRLGHIYLTQSSYSLLAEIFTLPLEDPASSFGEQLPSVLKVLLSSTPPKSDHTVAPSWVLTIGEAMFAYSQINPDACTVQLPKVWKNVATFLESSDAETRKATAGGLSKIAQCFTAEYCAQEVAKNDPNSPIRKIISQVSGALDSVAHARAIPEVLSIITALIWNLRHRASKTSASAAEPLLLPLIKRVADLRTQKSFEYKEAADLTLGMAMHVLGPHVLLEALPLNLEPASRQPGEEPKAFLLPLLSQAHPSPLSHFISYFVPLSEKMFDLQQTAESQGRQSEAKVWNVLVGQVWSGLVGYCWGTPDIKESLNPTFSQLLSQVLYSQAELRPAILRALKVIVDSTKAIAEGDFEKCPTTTITVEDARVNLDFLRTQGESWLAVLFNVFGSVDKNARGMVGDVITSWASVCGEQEINKAYGKVIQLFKTNLAKTQQETARPNNTAQSENANLTATAQDILILLLPYMSASDAGSLFELCMAPEVLSGKDNGIQKRGYKVLAKLVEGGKIAPSSEEVLKRLDELVDGLLPAAKKDRFTLLSLLVDRLETTSLHVIPMLIPEAVLGTKEPSEKSRNAAFDLVVSMGKKMNSGGVVKRSMMDGMDEEDAPDAVASIDEFITMMAGGLAGASPHMISASVTAISRLVFEFKDSMSTKMHDELLQTLMVFLTSANREIVKSTIGYIKLAIHTLPVEILRPHLKDLVVTLLAWSHDHKNHFKVKVRHIFERMLRRFSFDEVYACAADQEAGKVLVNIKKRKDRAKRKRAARADGSDDDEGPSAPKAAAGDAFEDVLYGSESELGDDDDDDEEMAPAQSTSKGKKAPAASNAGVRLRVDNDEPMDLLHNISSKVTSASNTRRRKPGQEAAHFKTDDDTGRMVIDEEGDEEEDNAHLDVAGTAYKESMTSVDGFTRGPSGKIKFNKDTKKRRREEAEDVVMEDVEAAPKAKKNKKKAEPRLGHEFKAKKAGGDIKKNGVDPYAYLSLGDAAKRQKKGKLGVTGKR
ncbi:ribosomal RNA-processing protein 12 [Ephemerocybe angulata]|uniref:Ribosomal RNA-processing protein 12 n=1 Tax=Ephemerocybe angulata TaxID=980116 RepID=A0A8H6I9A1_9AGAR|nr:ribosomal RNA-processing protein 12 [Tulosesus angulatus]